MKQIDPHICQICNKFYKHIANHVKVIHKLDKKDYYDKYLKSENEDICPVCDKETTFLGITYGYRRHCSTSCSSADPNVQAKNRKTNMEKYGVEHNWNNGILRENYKKTMLEKYGVDHNWKSSKLRSKEKFKPSSYEEYFMKKLDKLGIKYEYRYYGGELYPYECDFHLPNTDTFIEINGSALHDDHIFDPSNDSDVKELDYLKEKAKTSSWYKSKVRIWLKDKEKYDVAVHNKLKYIVLWSYDEIDEYLRSLETID